MDPKMCASFNFCLPNLKSHKQVDITVSKNQVLQILYLAIVYNDKVLQC